MTRQGVAFAAGWSCCLCVWEHPSELWWLCADAQDEVSLPSVENSGPQHVLGEREADSDAPGTPLLPAKDQGRHAALAEHVVALVPICSRYRLGSYC